MNKTKSMEEIRDKIKAQQDLQKGTIRNGHLGFYGKSKFKARSSSRSNKKSMMEKPQNQS